MNSTRNAITRYSLRLALALVAICVSAPRAGATAITTAGAAYAQDCANAGVPLPPTWSSNGLYWQRNNRPTNNFQGNSFEAIDGGYSWYAVSYNPPGMCVILAHVSGGTTANFDVICQGSNGKACFWEGSQPWEPTANGVVLTSTNQADIPNPPFVVGGTDLLTHDHCTKCHAGENAFITHVGQPTDMSGMNWPPANYWWPTAYYDPLVPAQFPQNRRPETFPGYPPSNSGPNGFACVTCHTSGAQTPGGRFPELSSELDNNYCRIVEEISNRNSSTDGMPLGNACNPSQTCALQNDNFVKAIVNVGCKITGPKSGKWGVFQMNRQAGASFNSPTKFALGTAGYGNGVVYPAPSTDPRRLSPTVYTTTVGGTTYDSVIYGVGVTGRTSAWLKHLTTPAVDQMSRVTSLWNPAAARYEVWEYDGAMATNPTRHITANAVVFPAGPPVGIRRYDSRTIVTYRGTDGGLHLYNWNPDTDVWSYSGLPHWGGDSWVAATDPTAYKFNDNAMSILYAQANCSNCVGEYRIIQASGYLYSVTDHMTSIPVSIKAKTNPVGRRNASSVPCMYVTGTDGIYQMRHTGSSENVYAYSTPQRILTSNYVSSSPMPYTRADGLTAVVWSWINGTNVRIYETVNTSGTTWSTSFIKQESSGNVPTGDPAPFVNAAGNNAVVYRTATHKVIQIEETSPGNWTASTLYDPAATP
jgi:hypothetical protein